MNDTKTYLTLPGYGTPIEPEVWLIALNAEPARLDSIIYSEWLKESPKKIEGGPLELSLCDGYGEEDDAWNLDARKISSDILTSAQTENLYILGIHDKFEGFKIYVNIKNKFLLMGHQHHPSPFILDDGTDLGDHPHFHQIRYRIDKSSNFEKERSARNPKKTHERFSFLFAGMNSAQFLESFIKYYYFDDGGNGKVQKSMKDQFQTELGKFGAQAEGI